MSGGFTSGRGLCNPQDYGVNLRQYAPAGTQVVPSATANVMGAWVSLGTLSDDAIALQILASWSTNTTSASGMSLDIGIGVSGSQIVIANLPFACGSNYSSIYKNMVWPLALPAGTQIWARNALNNTTTDGGQVTYVQIDAYDGVFDGREVSSGTDALGQSATGMGTTITTAFATNTKGAWSQIVASTLRDYCALMAHYDSSSGGSTPLVVADIGIGPSGSQQIIIANDICAAAGYSNALSNGRLYDVSVPAGSSLWARGFNNGGSAALNVGVSFTGFYK